MRISFEKIISAEPTTRKVFRWRREDSSAHIDAYFITFRFTLSSQKTILLLSRTKELPQAFQ